MENKVSNLIKNVLEENALKFKEGTSEILYSKVSNRLKQQYVEVSKKLFKNVNENVRYPELNFDPSMMAPPAKGDEKPPKPPYENAPSRGLNPGPWLGGPKPERSQFPPGADGDNEYRVACRDWYDRWSQWWKANEAYQPGKDRPVPPFRKIFKFDM
jgi:hypothetical protein